MVHDATGADGVAHALIDAVLQGDVDVALEGVQATDAKGGDDVIGVFQSHRAIRGGHHGGWQVVGLDILAAKSGHHVQVGFRDVMKAELGGGELGHAQQVLQ